MGSEMCIRDSVHDAALLASKADLPDRVFRRRVAVLTGREPGAHRSLGGQVALLFACEGPHVELGLEAHRGGGCSRDGVGGGSLLIDGEPALRALHFDGYLLNREHRLRRG